MKKQLYCNPILEKWEKERLHRLHIKMRDQEYTSVIDNTQPRVFPHLVNQRKRRQLEKERISKIERENRLLLLKMSEIASQHPNRPSKEFAAGTRLDSHMNPMIDCHISEQSSTPGNAKFIPSLNFQRRKEEQRKIADENMALLQRILKQKSMFSREEWEKDRALVEYRMKMIRRRPPPELALTLTGTMSDVNAPPNSARDRRSPRGPAPDGPLSARRPPRKRGNPRLEPLEKRSHSASSSYSSDSDSPKPKGSARFRSSKYGKQGSPRRSPRSSPRSKGKRSPRRGPREEPGFGYDETGKRKPPKGTGKAAAPTATKRSNNAASRSPRQNSKEGRQPSRPSVPGSADHTTRRRPGRNVKAKEQKLTDGAVLVSQRRLTLADGFQGKVIITYQKDADYRLNLEVLITNTEQPLYGSIADKQLQFVATQTGLPFSPNKYKAMKAMADYVKNRLRVQLMEGKPVGVYLPPDGAALDQTAVMTEDGQVFIVATYWNSGVDGYSILLEAYNPATTLRTHRKLSAEDVEKLLGSAAGLRTYEGALKRQIGHRIVEQIKATLSPSGVPSVHFPLATMEDRHAVNIQRVYRGHVQRRHISTEHLAAARVQAVARGRRDRMKYSQHKQYAAQYESASKQEHDAATAIQRIHRGRAARRRVGELKQEEEAAVRIQAIQRGRIVRKQADALKGRPASRPASGAKDEDAAASRVQALYRGRAARKRVAVAKEERKQEDAAAARIQAVHRGKKTRQQMANERAEQENAAKLIQSRVRGHQTRQKVQVGSQQNEEEDATYPSTTWRVRDDFWIVHTREGEGGAPLVALYNPSQGVLQESQLSMPLLKTVSNCVAPTTSRIAMVRNFLARTQPFKQRNNLEGLKLCLTPSEVCHTMLNSPEFPGSRVWLQKTFVLPSGRTVKSTIRMIPGVPGDKRPRFPGGVLAQELDLVTVELRDDASHSNSIACYRFEEIESLLQHLEALPEGSATTWEGTQCLQAAGALLGALQVREREPNSASEVSGAAVVVRTSTKWNRSNPTSPSNSQGLQKNMWGSWRGRNLAKEDVNPTGALAGSIGQSSIDSETSTASMMPELRFEVGLAF